MFLKSIYNVEVLFLCTFFSDLHAILSITRLFLPLLLFFYGITPSPCMMQNFMAEAASSTQNPTGGSMGQGYNAYPSHGSAYKSPQSTSGHAGHAPTSDYGLVYGNSYGY